MVEDILKLIKNNYKMRELLSSCPLFILERMEKCNFPAGKFELFQGKKYDFTYIVVSGQIKIFLISTNGKSVV